MKANDLLWTCWLYNGSTKNSAEKFVKENNHEEDRRATESEHFLHIGSAKKLKANSQKHHICATKQ